MALGGDRPDGAVVERAGVMKHHCAHPPKAGKSVREGAAQKKSKSQQHPEPASKKADGGQKRSQEKEITQPAKKREKRQREQSPEGSWGTKKVKLAPGKTAAWQPLPDSSIDHLGVMMDSVILFILSKSIQEKDDIQKHLNLLKERLLRHYKTLKVPIGKLSNLKNVLSLKVAEKQNLSSNEEAMALLQVTMGDITLMRISESERERMLRESLQRPGPYAALLCRAMIPEYLIVSWRGNVSYFGGPNKAALPRNLMQRLSNYLQESFIEMSQEDYCSIPGHIDRILL
ncbi:centromere protein Q isoform X3 [Chrysemys picta bellii]|uniref:centromere protein Q isoform X3 n=1 Tax=Chrysemys picta bellii TaxID=8478 RepID=UPI0032B23FC5